MRFIFVVMVIMLVSCHETYEQRVKRLNKEWKGVEVVFPVEMLCIAGNDTVEFSVPSKDFTIVTYVDSITENMSNAAMFRKWKKFMHEINTLTSYHVCFHYVINCTDVRLIQALTNYAEFPYTICMDKQDRIGSLNRFPKEGVCSFLLNREKRVIALGNPYDFPQTAEDFKNRIKAGNTVEERPRIPLTQVNYKKLVIDLGEFDYNQLQKATFTMKNVGKIPLVVSDVVPSSFDFLVRYGKHEVNPNRTWTLNLEYKGNCPRDFEKDVLVYCNLENSPLKLKVRGSAK